MITLEELEDAADCDIVEFALGVDVGGTDVGGIVLWVLLGYRNFNANVTNIRF
jgi:hypothetical protein